MPFNIGPGELIILLVIALVVFGPGRLPEVGQALGKSIREFRKAASDITESTAPTTSSTTPATPPPAANPTPVAPPAAGAPAPAAPPPAAPAAQDQQAGGSGTDGDQPSA